MIRFDKVYKLYDKDYSQIDTLCRRLDISPLTAKVLINRGFNTIESCEDFLNTDLKNLNDPFLLKGMKEAVERISKAIESSEKICIYGDYDADGVTSTSILFIFLKKLGANCFYYLPNRLEEGYGLNIDAIDNIAKLNTSLLITVDCGITNICEVDYLNEKGIDVIVTDHHQCIDTLPKAVSVINPNRVDCSYSFKMLAGVGVAFKLIQGLSKKLGIEVDYEEILPLVTIGTVADVVPLVGENRIIVKNGLNFMKDTSNLGVKALLEVSGLKDKNISSYHVGFVLGPRLNAGGRLGVATIGVKMFTTDDYSEALSLAEYLDEENRKRQEIEEEILKDAEKLIEEKIDLEKEKVIVLASDKWHSGVIGICASKITDKYFKPSILFSIEGDVARGSARSIPTFDIHNSLSRCSDVLEKFGGHKQAAGMLIKTQNINEFRRKINEVADEFLDEDDLIPEIYIDSELESSDIDIKTISELKKLEPFGMNNPSPQFIYRTAKIKSIRQIGKDNAHLKLLLEKNGSVVDTIGFNFGDYGNVLSNEDEINIVGNLDINDYMGNVSPQLIIREINWIKYDIPNIDDEYYYALKKYLKKNSLNFRKGKKNVEFVEKINRLDYIVDVLKERENVLVLVYNYVNILSICEAIQLEGRDVIKKTSISYNIDDNHKVNSIVILPVLFDINFKRYEKVIFYDLSFDVNNFLYFMDKIGPKNVGTLFHRYDIDLNKEILLNILPTIDEMRIIYKSFLTAKSKNIKIEPYLYLESINCKVEKKITKYKLDVTMEIFKDLNFIDFTLKDNYYFVKILEPPNEKIDILEKPKVKYLYSLKNSEM